MPDPKDQWRAEFDSDTGQHRIYDGEDHLIACVGNCAWSYSWQACVAQAIASNGEELRAKAEQLQNAAQAAQP